MGAFKNAKLSLADARDAIYQQILILNSFYLTDSPENFQFAIYQQILSRLRISLSPKMLIKLERIWIFW